ncbi:hypothetical protein C1H46_041261 [Malus baccata]|uniref:Uncharacterized protein n=1 Tax=Malus baccata TaxID=106549 RepID=A0A540KG50_MALBA|nr:hypothetical protein C1H46_041261 [Malus baccata]
MVKPSSSSIHGPLPIIGQAVVVVVNNLVVVAEEHAARPSSCNAVPFPSFQPNPMIM